MIRFHYSGSGKSNHCYIYSTADTKELCAHLRSIGLPLGGLTATPYYHLPVFIAWGYRALRKCPLAKDPRVVDKATFDKDNLAYQRVAVAAYRDQQEDTP